MKFATVKQQVVITVDGKVLTVGATDGMTVAEINLWLDVAKDQVKAGQIDERLPTPQLETPPQ